MMPAEGHPPAEVWWFTTHDTALGAADLAALGPEETARAAACASPAARHRYQVAHVLLRRVLASRVGAEPGELAFGREPCPRCGRHSGRPVLASRTGPCFSLAHCGDVIVIAVAEHRVGVDLERQRARCLCVLTGCMHPDDRARINPLGEADRHDALLRWWVRAEAVLKRAGAGIAHGLDGTAFLGTASGVTDLTAPAGYRAALAVTARPGAPR